MSADTSDREIVITRVIHAPVEKVWEAWTNPEHLIHWWGPDGFTNTFHEIDIRVGGVWRFMMHGPDGTDYPNKIVYEEIVPYERLVYLHSDDTEGASALHFRDTVTFEPMGDTTKVTLRLLCATPEERDKIAQTGAVEGGNQTLGRLDAYVRTM